MFSIPPDIWCSENKNKSQYLFLQEKKLKSFPKPLVHIKKPLTDLTNFWLGLVPLTRNHTKKCPFAEKKSNTTTLLSDKNKKLYFVVVIMSNAIFFYPILFIFDTYPYFYLFGAGVQNVKLFLYLYTNQLYHYFLTTFCYILFPTRNQSYPCVEVIQECTFHWKILEQGLFERQSGPRTW